MTPEERAAYRAFVRENHPDRGGDPDAFVAGLAAMRARPEPPEPTATDDVVFVRDVPLPARIAVALLRTVRRHRRDRLDRLAADPEPDGSTSRTRSAP
ncbi:hypothetical protein PSU4_35240 [Pseudonocardia sulfidoxydans NBRC 16205]|uniref:J domain-containing protein n=1 Tax=Pseudonocardia sulfidoxydans NBRC 16205 TaxID=1223511 RepID=A0A511DIE9_9PSEU|nr:hypothetical protein [Pseudonocardia sulfidoxydans]GEL24570.1 hypothetical protein PSU4_35240 [Pseudonocardia sulfidoxydans NBRC 16205]